MTIYRRGATEPWEELVAAAAGVLAGAAVFYFARLWLQREPLPARDRDAELEVEAEGPGSR